MKTPEIFHVSAGDVASGNNISPCGNGAALLPGYYWTDGYSTPRGPFLTGPQAERAATTTQSPVMDLDDELTRVRRQRDALLNVCKAAEKWAMLTQTDSVPWLEDASAAIRQAEGGKS